MSKLHICSADLVYEPCVQRTCLSLSSQQLPCCWPCTSKMSAMTEPVLAIPSLLAAVARGLPSVSYILQGPGTGKRRKEGVCVAYAPVSQAGGLVNYREACWGEKCVCTPRTSSPFTSCFIVRIAGLRLAAALRAAIIWLGHCVAPLLPGLH